MDASLRFGPFRLDTRSRILTRDGAAVPLAPRTLDLLLVFVTSGGRLLTKDELLRVVWGDVHVEEASLAFQVSTLYGKRNQAQFWVFGAIHIVRLNRDRSAAGEPELLSLWRKQVDGGPEEQVTDRGYAMSWRMYDQGICLLNALMSDVTIECMEFDSGRLSTIARFPNDGRVRPRPSGSSFAVIRRPVDSVFPRCARGVRPDADRRSRPRTGTLSESIRPTATTS